MVKSQKVEPTCLIRYIKIGVSPAYCYALMNFILTMSLAQIINCRTLFRYAVPQWRLEPLFMKLRCSSQGKKVLPKLFVKKKKNE